MAISSANQPAEGQGSKKLHFVIVRVHVMMAIEINLLLIASARSVDLWVVSRPALH